MRKCVFAVTLAFAISAVPSLSIAQGRTTKDPNAGTRPAISKPQEAPDPRLAKKITYDSGYKRLHTVVEDIGRLSGVQIYCGQSAANWRVRDIPVVICVQDMPLGKLLRAIADATHTHLASEQVGKKSKKSYRIYRRSVDEAKIDSYFDSVHKQRMEAISWQWDTMIAYSKVQPILGVSTDGSNIQIPQSTWLIAKLMASAGADAKDRLLDGETIRFSGDDPIIRDTMTELYMCFWENNGVRRADKQPGPSPTDMEIEASSLQIKLVDTGASGLVRANFHFGPLLTQAEMYTVDGGSLDEACNLKTMGLKVPDPPKEIQAPSYKDDMANPEMVLLSTQYNGRHGLGWDSPLLKAEIDVDQPKDLKEPVFADMIRALAKAGKVNIVTEDFTSHKGLDYQQMERLFAKKTTITKALTNIKPKPYLMDTDYAWFFNEKDKLIVGWADDGSLMRWRFQHRNLPPETLISGLKAKLEGPGVELDDIAHLKSIPKDSFEHWIRRSKDFKWIDQAQSGDDCVWQLYDALEPTDKLLAKSEKGLPLAKFDTSWIAGFFKAQKLQEDIDNEPLPQQDRQKILGERKLKARVTSDPKIITTMVMRIRKGPATKRWDPQRGMANVPNALQLSKYDLVIDYRLDGEDRQMSYWLPFAFPIYSPQREAEVIRAVKNGEQ